MAESEDRTVKSRLLRLCLAFLGIIAFVTIAIELEQQAGISFAITYRVACVIGCLFFLSKIQYDYPGERWPKIAIVIALIFDISLFFSPLSRLPVSKGDILFFGAPDAAILLAVRIATYPVSDNHQRALRGQMILGLILALAFCAIIIAMMFIPPRTHH